MNDAENSSSQGKSQDAGASSSSVKNADLVSKWEEHGPNTRVGTACKCGAHTSAKWDDGGRDWLVSHVQTEHRDMAAESQAAKDDAEKLRSGIVAAIAMEPDAMREHLQKLIS